ncbi:uncharacterized protein [Arachis hypogaea]|uniref:uncharacterized protein n=1 Tax=Arachis hypogaea TaxID=3818 RepID=UPI003B211F82
MKLLKDYDFELNYHPEKANIVADVLRKRSPSIAWMMIKEEEILKKIVDLKLGVREVVGSVCLNQLHTYSNFKAEIQKAQQDDHELQKMLQKIGQGKHGEVTQDGEKIWRYKERINLPNVGDLRHLVLTEAHKSEFFIHAGATKMYHDLNGTFSWL